MFPKHLAETPRPSLRLVCCVLVLYSRSVLKIIKYLDSMVTYECKRHVEFHFCQPPYAVRHGPHRGSRQCAEYVSKSSCLLWNFEPKDRCRPKRNTNVADRLEREWVDGWLRFDSRECRTSHLRRSQAVQIGRGICKGVSVLSNPDDWPGIDTTVLDIHHVYSSGRQWWSLRLSTVGL